MFNNSVSKWTMLALGTALAAWGVSHILPGVQLAAQNEKLGPPKGPPGAQAAHHERVEEKVTQLGGLCVAAPAGHEVRDVRP